MTAELSRWEPLREFATLRDEMERMFRQGLGRPGMEAPLAGAWSPALDVEERDDSYLVHLEVPGVKPEDIEVTMEEGMLTVSGERKFYDDRDEEGFRRVERRFGRFHRALRLPSPVAADKVEASYSDGILEITVPKAAEARPQRIEIKAK